MSPQRDKLQVEIERHEASRPLELPHSGTLQPVVRPDTDYADSDFTSECVKRSGTLFLWWEQPDWLGP